MLDIAVSKEEKPALEVLASFVDLGLYSLRTSGRLALNKKVQCAFALNSRVLLCDRTAGSDPSPFLQHMASHPSIQGLDRARLRPLSPHQHQGNPEHFSATTHTPKADHDLKSFAGSNQNIWHWVIWEPLLLVNHIL